MNMDSNENLNLMTS